MSIAISLLLNWHHFRKLKRNKLLPKLLKGLKKERKEKLKEGFETSL